MSNEEYLADLIGHIILQTGPVLIDFADWERGLPADALGVIVESTQEGYLVSISDTLPEGEGEVSDGEPTD